MNRTKTLAMIFALFCSSSAFAKATMMDPQKRHTENNGDRTYSGVLVNVTLRSIDSKGNMHTTLRINGGSSSTDIEVSDEVSKKDGILAARLVGAIGNQITVTWSQDASISFDVGTKN